MNPMANDAYLTPASILHAYPKATKVSLQKVHRGVDLSGCYFHLRQSLLASHSGSGNRYTDDSEFAPRVRMVLSLTFVPPDKSMTPRSSYQPMDSIRGTNQCFFFFFRCLKETRTEITDRKKHGCFHANNTNFTAV